MIPTCGEMSGSGHLVMTAVVACASSAATRHAIANKLKNTLGTRYHPRTCSAAHEAPHNEKFRKCAAAARVYWNQAEQMRTALALIVVLGVSAAAQAQTIGLPLPSIGLPLPQIGLPLPPTGLPPAQMPQRPARPSSQAGDHRAPRARPGRGASAIVYVVPVPEWPYAGAALPEPPPVAALPWAPAPQPVPESIAPDERHGGSASPDSTLSGILPAESPVPPATIYMIPGCYVGNLPPREVKLPAGCDADRASVFPSQR